MAGTRLGEVSVDCAPAREQPHATSGRVFPPPVPGGLASHATAVVAAGAEPRHVAGADGLPLRAQATVGRRGDGGTTRQAARHRSTTGWWGWSSLAYPIRSTIR